jgi:hypothetical protein
MTGARVERSKNAQLCARWRAFVICLEKPVSAAASLSSSADVGVAKQHGVDICYAHFLG